MMKKLAALLALTAGCATAESDGAFHISGRVDSVRVSHVVATNPDTAARVAVTTDADGSFDLALETGAQWVVTFADWKQIGKDMQVATLQANGLDAFGAASPTTLDLGTVKIVDRRAHGSIDYGDLLGALGLDAETATRMGRTDNLALRYANPDIDNDGTIDALQHDHTFRLDIAGAYKLTKNGRDATISDLVAGSWQNPGIHYMATTIAAVVPRTMGMNMASGTLQFQEPFHGTALGDATPTVAPGYPVGAPHIRLGERDGQPLIGVVAHGAHDAPTGAYKFGFANGQLTFTDVHAPSAALLASGSEFPVPFVRIQPTDAACKSDCDIAGITIDWRQFADGSWQVRDAQPARLDMVVLVNGTRTALAADLVDSAAIAWSQMPLGNTKILPSELAYVQTSEICYLAVSHTSPLGMKMTMSATNPACY